MWNDEGDSPFIAKHTEEFGFQMAVDDMYGSSYFKGMIYDETRTKLEPRNSYFSFLRHAQGVAEQGLWPEVYWLFEEGISSLSTTYSAMEEKYSFGAYRYRGLGNELANHVGEESFSQMGFNSESIASANVETLAFEYFKKLALKRALQNGGMDVETRAAVLGEFRDSKFREYLNKLEKVGKGNVDKIVGFLAQNGVTVDLSEVVKVKGQGD